MTVIDSKISVFIKSDQSCFFLFLVYPPAKMPVQMLFWLHWIGRRVLTFSCAPWCLMLSSTQLISVLECWASRLLQPTISIDVLQIKHLDVTLHVTLWRFMWHLWHLLSGKDMGPWSFLAAGAALPICVMIWDEFQLLESCIKIWELLSPSLWNYDRSDSSAVAF